MIKQTLSTANRRRSNLHGHRERETESNIRVFTEPFTGSSYIIEQGDKVGLAHTQKASIQNISILHSIRQVAYTFIKWLRNA